jgi:hypothetical protein
MMAQESHLAIPGDIHLLFLRPYSHELQPDERLWPLSKEPCVNQSFASRNVLEQVQAERCRWLQAHPIQTTFHWWPSLFASYTEFISDILSQKNKHGLCSPRWEARPLSSRPMRREIDLPQYHCGSSLPRMAFRMQDATPGTAVCCAQQYLMLILRSSRRPKSKKRDYACPGFSLDLKERQRSSERRNTFLRSTSSASVRFSSAW